MNDDWKARLVHLERDLELEDPSPKISAYHDMPYAIFRYPPEAEFQLRKEVELLATRLGNRGKRVTAIPLSSCLHKALASEGYDSDELRDLEQSTDCESVTSEIHEMLGEDLPLTDLVAEELPADPDPTRDIVFLTRVGALFPVYRTSALLEHLKGRIAAPTVLFYPGAIHGPTGLSFMGIFEPEPNYRPKIY